MAPFNFFKKGGDNEIPPQDQQIADAFEKEFLETASRYISKPQAILNLSARDPKTNEIIPFAIGFAETFDQWKSIQSLADRRGVIYALLDGQIGNQLQLWQIIERYTDDRYPQKALEIANKHRTDKDAKNANFWNALARTNLVLTDYSEAESNCREALELDANNIRTKRVYGDVLHCTGREKQAHEIYEDILKTKLPKQQQLNLPIQDLLGFAGDILNSPIYALGWLRSDERVSTDLWAWANEEFYYSPHFRSQFAYELIRKGENLKGFVKLHTLAKEMPWFKEAVMNSSSLIDQLGLTEQMKLDKIKLEQVIKDNNWG